MTEPRIPDPALVVLIGPSGSGKSTWAAARYRSDAIVSSDSLRAVVGSGTADLDASADAFTVLELIVRARLGRRLTTVVDTLGTDVERRRAHLTSARAAGVATVAVLLEAPVDVTRSRNSRRDRPVPAATLAAQHRRHSATRDQVAAEGWDLVVTADTLDTSAPTEGTVAARPPGTKPNAAHGPAMPPSDGPHVVLQVSAFPWGQDPLGWLTSIARAADEAGFAGLGQVVTLGTLRVIRLPHHDIDHAHVGRWFNRGMTDRASTADAVSVAFAAVPREFFLPEAARRDAHRDGPIPIGRGQTNSQPRTVAAMLRLLDVRPGHRVLDVGAGSAWTTALLARLAGHAGVVLGVELEPGLADWGATNLARWQDHQSLSADDPPAPATVRLATPGVLGAPNEGPWDRILVSADASRLPDDLVSQLNPADGRLVVPVRSRMILARRHGDDVHTSEHGAYRFVPLR